MRSTAPAHERRKVQPLETLPGPSHISASDQPIGITGGHPQVVFAAQHGPALARLI